MCGACGAAPADPVGNRVSGPLRRAAIARAASASTSDLIVKPITGGWTVSTKTGRGSVCRTFGELIDALSPDPGHVRTELTHLLLASARNAGAGPGRSGR